MLSTNNIIIVIIIVSLLAYIVYLNKKNSNPELDYNNRLREIMDTAAKQPVEIVQQYPQQQVNPSVGYDPYSDPIKQQDYYMMMDPLTYPQLRLPREVLERYKNYYDLTGNTGPMGMGAPGVPPMNMYTNPMFDNAIQTGLLVKMEDSLDGFMNDKSSPSILPLFKLKAVKNNNRYFYYVIDQRYSGKMDIKVPFSNSIKVNGNLYNTADDNGIPELSADDIIEGISVFPNTRFKVVLYKIHHFP